MPPPLSVDLRERAVAAVAAGASCYGDAARFGVSAGVDYWFFRTLCGEVCLPA